MNQKNGENNKIRLLHLVQGLGMGGAEVLLVHYIKALGTEEYDHYVYFFGDDGAVRKRIEALGVPVCRGKKRDKIKYPIRFALSLIALIRDLYKFIRSKHIQVIQSHLRHANQLAVIVGKLSGVPAFPTVHNTMSFVDRRSRWDPRVYVMKTVDGIIYRMASRILAVSEGIKEIIYQKYGLDNSKIVVLKNGIVLDSMRTNYMKFKKNHVISKNILNLIAVGSLTYQKALEVLVRATAELVGEGKDNVSVLIIGEGDERMQLEELIYDIGVESYVKLLGIRHDVMELMKDSDIFVMPSRYEGLSIAMIEAMACGLPIVASDAPGLNSYIRHMENGLLFPVEDYNALAQCILRLVNDEDMRFRLSCGARESFETEFDMRRNVKSLDILFRKYTTKN